ncbi:MAG: prolyl-tRNA synthetase associated domain-containing protein [Rubrivivax sp.]
MQPIERDEGWPSTERAYRHLFEHLHALGIRAAVVPYPAHTTVEEGKALRGRMSGTFTKNLLLKDKKGQLFLLSIHEDRAVDLKTIAPLFGGKGHLSFVAAERMRDLLGVEPGTLTPMGLLQDHGRLVTAVVDKALMADAQLNFHPLRNTESIGLTPAELILFIGSSGRAAVLVDFDT